MSILFILLMAQGYQDVSINCADPKELAYYKRLKENAKFDAPKRMWDDCVENGRTYIFKCRVHPEFGYFCRTGKRAMVMQEPEKLESEPVIVTTEPKPSPLSQFKFSKEPPLPQEQQKISATPEPPAPQELNWFQRLLSKIKSWFSD